MKNLEGWKSWVPWWAISGVVALSVLTVWLRLAVVRTTYDIHQIDLRAQKLQEEKEQVSLKLAAMRSPRRLEALARGRFGLSQPRSDQIVIMRAAPVRKGAQ